MTLRYTDPTITGVEAQYNGNISQLDWRGGDEENQQYGYFYDPMNRLMEAQYFNQSDPLKNRRYDEKIWNNNSNSAYDLNGNIQGIIRKGETGTDGSGMTTYGEMDEIRYSYRGNQLLKVDDLKNKNYGFKDGNNTDDDYRYDVNGNMIIDKNKEIESTSTATGNSVITYNYLNLPEIVRKNTGEYVKYIYDATGRKLRQEVYNESNQRIKQSIYAGEFFYEGENAGGNAQAQLKFINTEEGRVIMTGSTPEYQYHLKDHLGNVRVTFTTVEQVENFVATVEDANADQEEGEFLNYADATKVRSKLFDNTHRDDQNQLMRAASVTDDQGTGTKAEIATRLSGIGRERYGLAKSLRVMPGDVIRMEVFAKYTDPAKKNWVAGFEGALSEATVTAPATVVDGAMRNAAAASSALPLGALLAKPAGGVAPKAYLNYVMYDNNFVPITDAEQTNFVQVTEAARENGSNGTPERLYAEVQVKQAGYIYIYLSNDNYEMRGEPVDVFFDDFGIQQVHSKVVQTDDYYPFGLTFNSYARENTTPQDFRYNGKELQDELNLGWLDYGARMYMPDLGRWGAIDPSVELYYDWTPFNYCANNPILLIDLNGKEWFYHRAEGEDEPSWQWHDGDKYNTGVKDADGNDVILDGVDAVVIYRSDGEQLGDNSNLYGEGAKLAEVWVLGPDGANDIQRYEGFSISSDGQRFGVVAEGIHDGNYDATGKSGSLESNWAVEERGRVPDEDGFNPAHPERGATDGYLTGVFVHSSNRNGFAGL